MGWSGRAPAPPASEAGKGRQRQGARHVSDTQYRDRCNRHRYRQELVPHRWPESARCHRAAAEVVARPGGNAALQPAAVLDRYGGLRRRASSQSQAPNAWRHDARLMPAKYVRPYPTEPLVSYQINRQLSGWNLPPLVIRAFGAHGQKRRFDRRPVTSGLPRSADIRRVRRHVSKVPQADYSGIGVVGGGRGFLFGTSNSLE